jgi:hypothetical protein
MAAWKNHSMPAENSKSHPLLYMKPGGYFELNEYVENQMAAL